MQSKLTNSDLRQRVDNPIVLQVSSRIHFLCNFYTISKKDFFSRFVLQFLPRKVLYSRQYDALISERYTINQEFPTRGKHAGRTGTIQTIPYDLFKAMQDSLPLAEKTLEEELAHKRDMALMTAPDKKATNKQR